MYILKWTNKYSNDTGYVGKVSKEHFVNTFDSAKARKFPSEKAASNMIVKLNEYGEGDNNDFEVVAI